MFRVWIILAPVLMVLSAGFTEGAFYRLPPTFSGVPAAASPAAGATAGKPEARAELAKLKGRWQRPDGGYILEIINIADSGKVTAAYYNPRPINISQAQAALDGDVLKIFIELRDINYPGATYHLTFDAEKDRLVGVYFQPVLQQRFQVFFIRVK